MKHKCLLSSMVLAGLLVGQSAFAVDTIIEPFDGNQAASDPPTTDLPSSVSESNQPIAGVTRTLTVQRTGGTNAVTGRIQSGVFDHSQEVGVNGISTIEWTGLGGLDLRFQETLVLQIDRADWPSTVSLTVMSGAGSATVSQDLPGSLRENTEVEFDFSGESVDFSNITGLEMVVDGSGSASEDLDMRIDLLLARGPGACEFDPDLPADDPGCEPPPEPCPWDPDLPIDDPACVPPPAVPGISGLGLTVGLLGLPLIAGLLGGIRRRR